MGEVLIYQYDPATIQIDLNSVVSLLFPLLGLSLFFALLAENPSALVALGAY